MAGTTLILQDGNKITLSVKHDRFARAVALNGNQAAAYRENLATEESDRQYDRQKAYALIAKSETVQKAIEYYKEKFSRGLQISENRFLAEIGAIAFFDPVSMFDECGNLLHIQEMPESARRAVKKIKVRKCLGANEEIGEIVEIELHDKLKALDRVGQIKGYLEKEKDKAAHVRVIMSGDGVSVDVGS